MNFADYISLIAVFIALLALIWQVHINNRQSKMQTFLTYNQRYQDILINLPIGMESYNFSLANFTDDKREEILRWIRAYFDLCSEEYNLNKNNLIDKAVWQLWESGMIDSMRKPAFKDAWKSIQSNNYFHHEFANYINNMVSENN